MWLTILHVEMNFFPIQSIVLKKKKIPIQESTYKYPSLALLNGRDTLIWVQPGRRLRDQKSVCFFGGVFS